MVRKKDQKLMKKGGSSSPKLKAESHPQHQNERANAVFNNPLLMDKIIKYSIYKPDGDKFDKQTINAVRLVSKSFLQCASSTLQKSGAAIFEHYVISRSYQKTLDRFLPVFSKPPRSIDSILPICLDVDQTCIIRRNSKSLRIMFEQFGEIISTLCVEYPLDGGSMTLNCENFNFPILQDFKFIFQTWINFNNCRNRKPISESNANGLNFLQNILQNSPKLTSFTFKNDDESIVNISSLMLPGTLKRIKFSRPISATNSTLLTKNKLPNLHELYLKVSQQSDMQVIYNILKHFQKQLTILTIEFFDDSDSDSDDSDNGERYSKGIKIRLPSLEKLKVLTLFGETISLFPEMRHVWSSLVPSLTSIVFKHFEKPRFLEFIQGSEFKNVTTLKLEACFLLSVPIMSEIYNSFPNVQTLALPISLRDASGAKYLFRNFSRLKSLDLTISVDGSIGSAGYKAVSTFLGISIEQATALIDKTEINVNVSMDNQDSIMNLKELTSLTLKAMQFYLGGHRKNIFGSETICRHGLEKMPNLKHIHLLGGFEILE